MKSSESTAQQNCFVAPDHSSRWWIIGILAISFLILLFYKRHYEQLRPYCSVSIDEKKSYGVIDKSQLSDVLGPIHTETTTKMVIPTVMLSVISADSEETEGENGSARNAVDGNPLTIWHTQWTDSGKYLRGNSPRCPHEIIIRLTPPTKISGITYLPRRGDIPHGDIRDYEVFLSQDGIEFGEPIKSGRFTNDKEMKVVSFQPTVCGFFKLRALSEINGNPFTSAAEIDVVRDGEVPDVSGKSEIAPDF